MQKLEESLTAHLQAQGVPDGRARRKSRNTVRGVYLMVLATFAILAGVAILVVPFFVLKEHPGAWLVGFGGLCVLGGFYLGLLGANAFSGEISDAETSEGAGQVIVAVGKAIGLARGKPTHAD